ncbi:MAG: signal peptidase I [Clostridia bacterium]|nr:signal peptidase I [Clostridia bacterium]
MAISAICTYLAKTGGYFLIIAYRLPITLASILLPIFPNIDWFLSSILEALVPVILFIYINYEHTIKINRLTRKEKKGISPNKSAKFVIIAIVLTVFIAGLFPYKPVAVMSNSMVPDFYRGYIVISKKIKKDDIKEIKVGDILEYQLESNVIIHRVIEIEEKDGTRLFTTKGDNNDFPDMKKVEEKQVLGIVKFKIPYAGYPSVWFSEILFKRKSVVRT